MLHNVNYVNMDELVKRIENIENSLNGKYQSKDTARNEPAKIKTESVENIERTNTVKAHKTVNTEKR